MYQRLANQQHSAQECVANSLNLYFDTVTSLNNRYGVCKEKCLTSNPALAKELRDSADETVKG